ncbi:MAG TPA: Tn3 family transposase [Bacteroidales bacterium]
MVNPELFRGHQASLAQKDVTQATIIRKLSSYARQNQTKKALWELDNICQSIYTLDFIDDVTLRQSVQKTLNREQIWNECTRLIANAIIYYNTLLLSKVYEQKLESNDKVALEIIKGISPVAWQHVNLYGTFEFTKSQTKVDIDALAAIFDEEFRKKIQLKNSSPLPDFVHQFFGYVGQTRIKSILRKL